MYPFTLHSNNGHVIWPKNKPFLAETLNARKSSVGGTKDDSIAQAIMITAVLILLSKSMKISNVLI
jgi:hypothetical protein